MLTTYDPLSHHFDKGSTHDLILQECFLIINWCYEKPNTSLDFKGVLENHYGYGALHEMTGGKVDASGIYTYPEDPALYPLVSIEDKDEICWVYPYGIVSIRSKENGETFTTRMD